MDATSQTTFSSENIWISIKISLKFVRKGPINNSSSLAQIMAWRRPGDKPLTEPMMVNLPTHICVTRPQWFNIWIPVLHHQWRGALMFSLICSRINGWVNNREAGDLRRHHAHYDVIVMKYQSFITQWFSWRIIIANSQQKFSSVRYHQAVLSSSVASKAIVLGYSRSPLLGINVIWWF